MARDYTYQELMAMQEEATQRVREMQRRAQLTAQRAQEELDRKQSASPPISAPQEKPAQAKATEHSTHREPQHPPMGLPPTAGKMEDDADRLSFLDNKPQHPQPPTGKPHSPKHISLPVDYIQDKKEMPSPIKEGAPHASHAPVPDGPAPGPRLPLPLGLAEGGSDQSLLLALMLLLNGEGADELLLLALLYIMM